MHLTVARSIAPRDATPLAYNIFPFANRPPVGGMLEFVKQYGWEGVMAVSSDGEQETRGLEKGIAR